MSNNDSKDAKTMVKDMEKVIDILNEAKEPKVTYDISFAMNNSTDTVCNSLHYEAIALSQEKINEAITIILKYNK